MMIIIIYYDYTLPINIVKPLSFYTNYDFLIIFEVK